MSWCYPYIYGTIPKNGLILQPLLRINTLTGKDFRLLFNTSNQDCQQWNSQIAFFLLMLF
jgi:hypothetical protein